MKQILVLATLSLALLAPTTHAQKTDKTLPQITIGLADQSNMTGVLPFNAGRTVPAGRIRFRARVESSAGVRTVLLTLPNASSSMTLNPLPKTAWIGGGWDTRRVASGTTARLVVKAWNGVGGYAVREVEVRVR